ncbi:xanthine dehydrogenase family protein molybdopterin-binding subunit [Pseudomonas sp. NPDC089554]|uniref:xanthine dehydrogenase family protein molybdopterin-binding subunit n=1 Tax=Pseudomonas sp. NPDC089554 TaxID=3390653 RepID=UPI003CFF0A46
MTESIIGRSQRRIEGRHKVTGNAKYAADYPVDNLVYAYGVYSTIACGTVEHINEAQALRMPGVLTVIHHGNMASLHQSPSLFSFNDVRGTTKVDEQRLPFEDNKVSYFGQFVALVVANTFEQARAAALRIKVKYSEAPAIKSLEESIAKGLAVDGGSNHHRGNAESAFEGALQKVDVVYRTPVETHNPMEMHATTAWWDNGRLYVYESTQGVITHRNVLAAVFDLPPDRVEVRAPFIGSGFGSKLFPWPHSIAACAAAKAVSRPVQFVLPRAQMFTAVGHRPETRQRIRLAADGNGRLTSIRHESSNSTSMHDPYLEQCGGVTQSLYSCPNVSVTHQTAGVNRGAPTSMRAPGAAPGLFALESAVDELALACNIDPLAFRQMNIATLDESINLPWSSNHLPEALKVGAERFGWAGRKPGIGSMRDGDEIIGYGIGACNWEAYRLPCDARATFRSDGTVLVQCGLQDIGTGTYTILAQAVAQVTGLPIEQINVELGSSSLPAGPLSGGSWVTASAMPAVAEATRAALERLKAIASSPKGQFPGVAPKDIQVKDGLLIHGDQRVGFAQVLKQQRLAQAQGEASAGTADTTRFSYRSFGAHFVEVRWDPGISRLRVSRVVSAIDAGRAINPLTARNQVEGAIVMAIGMSLFEATDYDHHTGIPTNNNYAEYAVPVHADMPEVDVILLDYPDYRLNEFGARGIGEIGATGLAAAVANAVFHATGKRVRELPITLDKLMDGIPT